DSPVTAKVAKNRSTGGFQLLNYEDPITNSSYGPVSFVLSHTPFVGWAGNAGGVSRCGVEKSKKSVRSLIADDPSRCVNGDNWKRVSINFRIDVVSVFT